MNLDDLKDQSKERLQDLSRQVQDSSIYITLKDRYDLLPQRTQKIVLTLLAVLGVSLLLFPPIAVMMTASDDIKKFDETRNLTRDLLRTDRELKKGPLLRPTPSTSALRGSIRSLLERTRIIDEQILGIETSNSTPSELITRGIKNESLLVHLQKLNLRQLVDVGYGLQAFNNSVKVTQMSVAANSEDDHYFDVRYLLTAYRAPVIAQPKDDSSKKKRKPRRSRRKRK